MYTLTNTVELYNEIPHLTGKYDYTITYTSLSFAYPFPDIAALMDRLYISRYSSVRPTCVIVQ